MSVVSGCGANKLDLVEFIPRRRAEYAELHCKLHHVVHNVERRAVNRNNLVRFDTQKVGKKFSCLLHACGFAVISCVDAAHHKVAFCGIFKHGHGYVELFLRRLSPRHIDVSVCFLEFFVGFLFLFEQLFKLAFRQCFVVHKCHLSYFYTICRARRLP